MRLGGRVQAAAEVLADIDKRKRPASDALKDWGLSHRFAGSGDRAGIGNLVYDALRHRASLGYFAASDDPLLTIYALLLKVWGFDQKRLQKEFEGDKFAPPIPEEAVLEKIVARKIAQAELHLQANIPEWCVAAFEANFSDDWLAEAKGFMARPSLDMRVNTLKSDREKVTKQLSRLGAEPTAIARHGLRIRSDKPFARQPNVQAE